MKERNISSQSDSLKLEKTVPLSGVKGRIDHLATDTSSGRLFIAGLGNNSVEVINIQTGERLHSLGGIEEPQGILYLSQRNVLCVSSGGSGNCNFYNCQTYELIKSITIGTDADNIRYDPDSKLIYVGYGSGGIAVVDALKYSEISTISLSGHPESFQLEKAGSRIFVNVPVSRDIEVIDRKRGAVVSKWELDAEYNFPMCLDENEGLLFIGCRRPAVMLVYETGTGKELTRFEIEGDADDIYYDANRKLLLVSCSSGFLEEFKEGTKESYKLIQRLSSSKGARTSLYVPESGYIYLAVPKSEEREAGIWIYKLH